MSEESVPVVVTVPNSLSVMDGFRFAYGACCGLAAFALVALCVRAAFHWLGLA